MLKSLLRRKHWPIALDIGTDSVKVLQVHRAGGSIAVRASGRWRFPASASQDPAERRRLAVGAVREILRKGSFCGNRVVSALSCNELKIKNVRLSVASCRNLDEAVRREARERFGQDFAPDQLHCLKAGQIRQGMDNYQEVIILAVPSEIVDGHLSMLNEMGLRPQHIDAEPMALFRPFERMLRRRDDEESISVVVDLGHSSTKVVVARGRQVVLVKNIAIGGRNFAQAIAKQLKISCEEAADLRLQVVREHLAKVPDEGDDGSRTSGAGDPNSVSWTILDAVRGDVEDLAREIALCLRYCSVTFRGLRPDCLTMTGGQAYDCQLVQLLGDQLGVTCQIGQPLKGVDTSAVDLGGDRRGVLAEWSVCAGLALRGIGLEHNRRRARHERDRLSA